ncbi:MAG: hypothetical protein HKL90_10670 [Elusimicrobia bacterium]|nr:hypothetical protein [Elusimicrobiota bacterium]
MTNKFNALVFSFLSGAATVAAAAPQSPSFFAKLDAAPGAWAEYSVTFAKPDGGKSVMKMHIAAVGKTADGTWVESRMTPESPKPLHAYPPSTVKLLLDKNETVIKAYVQTPRGVMDMSAGMSAASREAMSGPNATKRKKLGPAKVSVPAGTFETTRYAVSGGKVSGDVWLKSGVGPYGLIRQVMHDGGRTTTFELLASGMGAKSSVDETQAHAFGSGMAFHRPPVNAAAPASADSASAAEGSSAGSSAPGTAPAPAAAAPATDSTSSDQSPPTPGLGGILGRAIKGRLGL